MRNTHKHYSEAKYARSGKRWTYNKKQARQASKRYNKAIRREVKLQLAREPSHG